MAARDVAVVLRYCKGHQKEFGWMPDVWYCETPTGGPLEFSAFVGSGRTAQAAIDDFNFRVQLETGIVVNAVPPLTLAQLFEERKALYDEYQCRVALGTGSSVIDMFERKIADMENRIREKLDFLCPHCKQSLRPK